MRAELARARAERDQAQSFANTAQTLLTTEKSAQAQVLAQKKQLEHDIQSLRDDLGFFEKLIPPTGVAGIAIRGLQAEMTEDRRLRWRILLIQPQRNVAEFQGHLELSLAGTLQGKPWASSQQGPAQAIRFAQFGRFQGVADVPPQVTVRSISVKVLDGSVVKAAQSARL